MDSDDIPFLDDEPLTLTPKGRNLLAVIHWAQRNARPEADADDIGDRELAARWILRQIAGKEASDG